MPDGDDEATLAARVLVQEHQIYPMAVRWFAEERLRLVDGRVVFDARTGLWCLISPQVRVSHRSPPEGFMPFALLHCAGRLTWASTRQSCSSPGRRDCREPEGFAADRAELKPLPPPVTNRPTPSLLADVPKMSAKPALAKKKKPKRKSRRRSSAAPPV